MCQSRSALHLLKCFREFEKFHQQVLKRGQAISLLIQGQIVEGCSEGSVPYCSIEGL